MGVFSKVFGSSKDSKKNDVKRKDLPSIPQKPTWTDAWTRTVLQPEEVHDLLRACTTELKIRGLEVPFLLLPFRPASDLSATRTFIRNYFGSDSLRSDPPRGEHLLQELRLTEPLVIVGVMKWCWSRLPGGVVTWEAYELFRIGENDSSFAPDAFATFIPISVGSGARSKIIFDFFEILSAIAAHGKVNGFGGRKLSRYAAWWAFEFSNNSNGFDGGYKTWTQAADATSHLFFAYLRSLSPSSAHGKSSILGLPRALQHLLESTEYPPSPRETVQSRTSKVVMIVDSVSPTPFALLRRAKNFHYREDDTVLRHFSDFDDPVAALTNECKRVLKSISSANESTTAKHSTSLRDASWSRFEDIGFDTTSDFEHADEPDDSTLGHRPTQLGQLRSAAASKTTDLGRPTTPSWADFMSSGFQEQVPNGNPSHLLPPDKILPPINGRSHTSQAIKHDDDSMLEPGELASISAFGLDDTFWWVWMTSLAGEEPPERKAAFGRCALVETKFGNQWIVVEEIIKGAAPEPDEDAYIAEKKSRFGFSTRGKKLTRSKSTAKGVLPKPKTLNRAETSAPMSSKTNIAPDQHARIQAAAAALQERNRVSKDETPVSPRRARHGDDISVKTSSVLTLQPMIMNEAAPALQWANKYDKNAIRAKYLGDEFAGRGSTTNLPNGATDEIKTAKALEATANGARDDERAAPVEQARPDKPAAPRTTSGPRGSATKGSINNETLLDTLQNGPKGSKPYQSTSIPNQKPVQSQSARKPIPIESARKPEIIEPQIVPSSAPAPPPKDVSQNAGIPPQSPQFPSAPASQAVPVQTRQPSDTTAKPSALAAARQATSSPVIQQGSTFAPSSPQIQQPTKAPEPPVSPSQSPYRQIPSLDGPAEQPLSGSTINGRPESPETSRNKLQKKPAQGGGIRGFLGRRKKDEPVQDITARKPTTGNTSAVAAAKAALEAKTAQAQKPPEPANKVTSKRFSMIKKAEPEVTTAPVYETREPEPVQAAPLPPIKDESKSVPVDTPHDPQRSRSLAEEEARAEKEFRSFDQGPLTDQPAFAPASIPSRSDTPTRHDSVSKDVHDISPVESTPPQSPTADVVEPVEEELISPNDRWAQIRKNAAERAALARPDEVQSKRTDKTDEDVDGDGDTSGEETIESRVARIKARVAELTGNMEMPANRR